MYTRSNKHQSQLYPSMHGMQNIWLQFCTANMFAQLQCRISIGVICVSNFHDDYFRIQSNFMQGTGSYTVVSNALGQMHFLKLKL